MSKLTSGTSMGTIWPLSRTLRYIKFWYSFMYPPSWPLDGDFQPYRLAVWNSAWCFHWKFSTAISLPTWLQIKSLTPLKKSIRMPSFNSSTTSCVTPNPSIRPIYDQLLRSHNNQPVHLSDDIPWCCRALYGGSVHSRYLCPAFHDGVLWIAAKTSWTLLLMAPLPLRYASTSRWPGGKSRGFDFSSHAR